MLIFVCKISIHAWDVLVDNTIAFTNGRCNELNKWKWSTGAVANLCLNNCYKADFILQNGSFNLYTHYITQWECQAIKWRSRNYLSRMESQVGEHVRKTDVRKKVRNNFHRDRKSPKESKWSRNKNKQKQGFRALFISTGLKKLSWIVL